MVSVGDMPHIVVVVEKNLGMARSGCGTEAQS
jgi:hypothetical protein